MHILKEHWSYTHGAWCEYLRGLGILTEEHEGCARHYRVVLDQIRRQK